MSDYKSNLIDCNPVPPILQHHGVSTREEIHEFLAKNESIDPDAAIQDARVRGQIKQVKKSKQSDLFDEFDLA